MILLRFVRSTTEEIERRRVRKDYEGLVIFESEPDDLSFMRHVDIKKALQRCDSRYSDGLLQVVSVQEIPEFPFTFEIMTDIKVV